MSNVNRVSLSHLELRLAVPRGILGLLRRAQGLELLSPEDDAEEIVDERTEYGPLAAGETHLGFRAPASGPVRLVHCVQRVNYPIAGYPEAYCY